MIAFYNRKIKLKKNLFIAATAIALFATTATANEFGRNTNNVAGSIAATHNTTTGTNVVTLTGGAAKSLLGVKLYGNANYQTGTRTWAGNVGVTKTFANNVYVDVWANSTAGVTTATAALGFNF
jgi:hypothetical protein